MYYCEKGEKYDGIHYYNEKIILLPKKDSSNVKWVEMNDGKAFHVVEYPKDAVFFREQPPMFNRYSENKNIIIYPLRGLNYYLIIDKNNDKIEWMKPVNIHETLIEMKDNDRIKKMGAPFREGILLLEEFIEGIL